MKRLVLTLLVASSCSPTSTGGDGGDDYGLPPIGDGGQVLSLGPWALEAASDPEGTRLIAAYARAFHGQSADLTNDGEVDLVVQREADGTLVRRFEEYSSFRPTWVSMAFPDGRLAQTMDLDGRGFANVSIEEDPRTQARVELLDLDFTSQYELRRTTTRDVDAQTDLVVEERDPEEDGTWVESRRFTLSAARNQGTCAPGQGLSNFPVYGPFNSPGVMVPADGTYSNLVILRDGPVKCDPAQSTAVRAAVRCALKKLSCLDGSSANAAARVRSAVSSKRLYIGCNNGCPGADATTTSPSISPLSSGRMNLASYIDTLTPDEACTVVLHELMHFADVSEDSSHADGDDRIYACARYCNKCIKRGPKMPSDMEDCVACAETADERRKCGSKEEVQMGACLDLAFCHAGLGGNARCDTCNEVVVKDCKGAPLDPPPEFLCCATCPATHPTNDRPCSANPTLADSCNRQPPECP